VLLYYFTYIDDARSNTNQVNKNSIKFLFNNVVSQQQSGQYRHSTIYKYKHKKRQHNNIKPLLIHKTFFSLFLFWRVSTY